MNCREANRILDSSPSTDFDSSRIQAAERHIETCGQCRDAWHAYRETAALQIPTVPLELRKQVRVLVDSNPPKRKPVRLNFLIGIGLAVGAAGAATIISLPREGDERVAVERMDTSSSGRPEADDSGQPLAALMSQSSSQEPGSAIHGEPMDGQEHRPTAQVLDPNSVVVVLTNDESLDPEQALVYVQFYEELLKQLGTISGLNVISPDLVNGYVNAGAAEEEIASKVGAGRLILLNGSAEPPVLTGILANVSADLSTGEVTFFGERSTYWPEGMPNEMHEAVARLVEMFDEARLRDKPFNLSDFVDETSATVLNASLKPSYRVAALEQLTLSGEGNTDAIVAAAIELATLAPGLRDRIWRAMYGIDNPYLIDPLLDSLVYDNREPVRAAAATTLATFIGLPRVDAALQQAQRDDVSERVRENARQAMESDEDVQQAALDKLLDDALPASERLQATLIMSGRTVRSLSMTDDAVQALFEIGASASDPDIRSTAWANLARGNVQNEAFKKVLLDDLRNHPDDRVRSAAASALSSYVDDPSIRAAFEDAKSDSAYRVRSMARHALREAAD